MLYLVEGAGNQPTESKFENMVRERMPSTAIGWIQRCSWNEFSRTSLSSTTYEKPRLSTVLQKKLSEAHSWERVTSADGKRQWMSEGNTLWSCFILR